MTCLGCCCCLPSVVCWSFKRRVSVTTSHAVRTSRATHAQRQASHKEASLSQESITIIHNAFSMHRRMVLWMASTEFTRAGVIEHEEDRARRAWKLNFLSNGVPLCDTIEEWNICSSSLQPFLSSSCPSGALLLLFLTSAHETQPSLQQRTPLVCALIRSSVSSLEAPFVAKSINTCLSFSYHHSYLSPLPLPPAVFVQLRLHLSTL